MAITVLLLLVSTAAMVTATGTELFTEVPLPSMPKVLLPHAATVPSEHSARLCLWPPARATTVLLTSTPAVRTGNIRCTVVLSPIWPKPLWPQAYGRICPCVVGAKVNRASDRRPPVRNWRYVLVIAWNHVCK